MNMQKIIDTVNEYVTVAGGWPMVRGYIEYSVTAGGAYLALHGIGSAGMWHVASTVAGVVTILCAQFSRLHDKVQKRRAGLLPDAAAPIPAAGAKVVALLCLLAGAAWAAGCMHCNIYVLSSRIATAAPSGTNGATTATSATTGGATVTPSILSGLDSNAWQAIGAAVKTGGKVGAL